MSNEQTTTLQTFICLCRKRQLLEDSKDDEKDQTGKGSSGSEQSAGGESGSEFSGEESESSEDADSDVADSEDEEEVKAPAKKPKQASLPQLSPFQGCLGRQHIFTKLLMDPSVDRQLTGMRA